MSYIVLDERPSAWFDVDDTLVSWRPVKGMDAVTIMEANVTPNIFHINQLKEHAKRGHRIVVWSAGGVEWATAVVDALELGDFVDIVSAKPTWIYDDKPASSWLGDDKRTFLDIKSGERIV